MRPFARPLPILATAVVALALGVAGGSAQEQPAQSVDEAGWQGVLGVRASVSAAQRYIVLLRPPSLAARVRGGWRTSDGSGDARVVGRCGRAAGAVPRAARCRRGADRSRVPLHARAQRLLGASGSHVCCAARSRPRGRGRLPGADRISSAGRRVGRRRAPVGGRRSRDRGSRRLRRHGRAARHGRRPVASRTCAAACSRASTSSIPAAAESRSRTRRFRVGRSATRPSSPGSSPAPRARTGCTGSRRVPRSFRFASAAGSRTPRAATASTRARIRSSPGSRRPSIPTTTATCSTPRASPSSGWSSRTRRSQTARCRARSPGRQISTCSRSSPPGTTDRQGPATGASRDPAARSTP